MNGRTILATLDGSAPNERLQLTLLQHRDGRLSFDLRQQHFAEGIGWYDQRGLELDSRQFRQLQALIGRALPDVDACLADEPPAATLPFPGPGELPRSPSRMTGSD